MIRRTRAGLDNSTNVHLILINPRVIAKSKSQNVITTPPPNCKIQPAKTQELVMLLLLASATIGYDDWSCSSRSRTPLIMEARVHILGGWGEGGGASDYEANIILGAFGCWGWVIQGRGKP